MVYLTLHQIAGRVIFASNFLHFLTFSAFSQKNVEKHNSTSIWSAPHPNDVQNIQKLSIKMTVLNQKIM